MSWRIYTCLLMCSRDQPCINMSEFLSTGARNLDFNVKSCLFFPSFTEVQLTTEIVRYLKCTVWLSDIHILWHCLVFNVKNQLHRSVN